MATTKKIKPSVNEHNQLTLSDGTRISIYGLNQNVKDFGYTMAPLTEAAPTLLRALKEIERINRNDHSMTARTKIGDIARRAIALAQDSEAANIQ